jgi:hypothetical protein
MFVECLVTKLKSNSYVRMFLGLVYDTHTIRIRISYVLRLRRWRALVLTNILTWCSTAAVQCCKCTSPIVCGAVPCSLRSARLKLTQASIAPTLPYELRQLNPYNTQTSRTHIYANINVAMSLLFLACDILWMLIAQLGKGGGKTSV